MKSVSGSRRVLFVAVISTLALAGTGCGGTSQSDTQGLEADQVADDEVTDIADEATTTIVTDEPATEDVSYLPELIVEGAESGPRPLLTWTAVDGTARYTLVVLGSDGVPYWAWSGPETSIHLGGFDDPDAIGPWVHEPMTWTVAAIDGDGKPIAISHAGVLTP